MKKHMVTVILILIFLAGAGIFAYPTVADQWNRLHQSRAIAGYQAAVEDMDAEEYQAAWQAAEEYNRSIEENTFLHDAFSQEERNLRDTEYWNLLNLGGTGIMGYISIPQIDVRFPIYHLPWYIRPGAADWRGAYVRHGSSCWRRGKPQCHSRTQRTAQRAAVYGPGSVGNRG